LKSHFAGKMAVLFETVTAALEIVGIPPLTGEGISSLGREAGTGRQQTGNEKKGGFHPAAARGT
jgi:hypothetical protein